MLKETETVINHHHHHHIDNGGVSLSIIDKGVNEGIVLRIDAQYFGYPSVVSEIRIDNLGPDWLEKIGLMFLASAQEIKKIDFEKRYE